MNSLYAIAMADLLRGLIVLSGGWLLGQCIHRIRRTPSTVIRARTSGLALLGGGLALGTCFRFGDSFNPALPFLLAGIAVSIYGMNGARPGDEDA